MEEFKVDINITRETSKEDVKEMKDIYKIIDRITKLKRKQRKIEDTLETLNEQIAMLNEKVIIFLQEP
jgi:hypothetical protein